MVQDLSCRWCRVRRCTGSLVHHTWTILLTTLLVVIIQPVSVFGCIKQYNCTKSQEEVVECATPAIDDIPICLSSSLISLSLHDTKIQKLYQSSLHFYSDLRHVNLSQNQINVIEENAFKNQKNVEELHLSDNNISKITPDIFNGLVQLRVLSLRGNYLEELNDSVFYHLSQLQHLDVSHNRISVIQERTFEQLPHLRLLMLHDNLLSFVPGNSLVLIPHLAELSLGGNDFKTLENEDFRAMKVLNVLDLSKTDFSEGVNDVAFEPLASLRILRLNGCQLQSIPKRALEHMPRLEELELNNNLFEDIPAKAFSENKRLRRIEIMGCTQLERINSDAFIDNMDLQRVVISKNRKLTYLEPETFLFPKVTHLDLHGNNLKYIPKDLTLWNDIPEWYIHNNPIVCNCSVSWLWKSLKDNNSTNSPEVICDNPKGLQDQNLATLHHNDLSCGLDPATQGIVIGVFVFICLAIIIIGLLFYIFRQTNKSGSSCVNRLLKGHKLGNGVNMDNGNYPRDPYHGYHMAKAVPVTEL